MLGIQFDLSSPETWLFLELFHRAESMVFMQKWPRDPSGGPVLPEQRAGHRVWMFQAKMESQGSAGLRMPQNTGNCPRWGVSKDRRTSFISCRPTRHLPLRAALTTCPLRFCYMRTTWLGYLENSVMLAMSRVQRLMGGLVPFLSPIVHLTSYQRKSPRSLHWIRFLIHPLEK